eukprot:jgi/Botrbrau1/3176/Bobra.37_2s0006.1
MNSTVGCSGRSCPPMTPSARNDCRFPQSVPLRRNDFMCRRCHRPQAQSTTTSISTRNTSSEFAQTSNQFELLVCTNKTCKKQGSQQIAKFAEDLHLQGLAVRTTGCLGACGAGPNIMVMPDQLQLRHVSTVTKMTDILREVCGFAIDEALLQATRLRTAGNAEARAGNAEAAERLYTEALALQVPGTQHLLLSNRSGRAVGPRGRSLRNGRRRRSCPSGTRWFHCPLCAPGGGSDCVEGLSGRCGGPRRRERCGTLLFAGSSDCKALRKQLRKFVMKG